MADRNCPRRARSELNPIVSQTDDAMYPVSQFTPCQASLEAQRSGVRSQSSNWCA